MTAPATGTGVFGGRLVRILAVFLLLAGPPVWAQDATIGVETSPSQGAAPKPGAASATGGAAPIRIEGGSAPASLDYRAWGAMADRAEAQIANANTASPDLERLRLQLADWREAFLGLAAGPAARSTRCGAWRFRRLRRYPRRAAAPAPRSGCAGWRCGWH